jgi:hypothetical protein
METRSKVKGVPQGIPTTSFIKEVSKTLPPTQGTYPTLHKQQLVEEFPESKFFLLFKTTQFYVSTEELEHPVPIHNLTSPKSLKFFFPASTSTLTSTFFNLDCMAGSLGLSLLAAKAIP